MYIRRKVFSLRDYDYYYSQRQFDDNEGMSTGSKVALGLGGTLAAGAGAFAAGRRGYLGSTMMKGTNQAYAKVSKWLGSKTGVRQGLRGVAAAEEMAAGNINRTGANAIRRGDLYKSGIDRSGWGIKDGVDIGKNIKSKTDTLKTANNNEYLNLYDKRKLTDDQRKARLDSIKNEQAEAAKKAEQEKLEEEAKKKSEKGADDAKTVGQNQGNGHAPLVGDKNPQNRRGQVNPNAQNNYQTGRFDGKGPQTGHELTPEQKKEAEEHEKRYQAKKKKKEERNKRKGKNNSNSSGNNSGSSSSNTGADNAAAVGKGSSNGPTEMTL